jgi:hypothetical protein
MAGCHGRDSTVSPRAGCLGGVQGFLDFYTGHLDSILPESKHQNRIQSHDQNIT